MAFLIVGFVPLLPFLLPNLETAQRFTISAFSTAVAFASVGVLKGVVLERSTLRSGLETLLTGGAAAALAYAVGMWLRQVYGAT